ncbi:MAG: hypothetical protein CK427_03525 [Leptospira sp.]|nr:MAG: hypothetical protein CK427_03525 [Leptospira sp.]
MRFWILLAFLFLSLSINGDSIRGKIHYDPKTEEGYFQGWNYSYRDKDTIIFVTFLISNLGPGSLNNGVSLYIQSKKTGTFYSTQELASHDLEALPGSFGQRSGLNRFYKKDNTITIEIRLENISLDLNFQVSRFPILALSKGDYSLDPHPGFLRADIGFARAKAVGELKFNELIIPLNGQGSLEHLNTNVEVYKYSKSWEILRAYSKNGWKFFYGGFTATDDFPKKFFKRYAILNEKNEIIYSGNVKQIQVTKWLPNAFSGYEIPVEQELQLEENEQCKVLIQDSKNLGEINVLSNISVVLRLFVRMFFARPYQIHKETKVEWNCNLNPDSEENLKFNNGTHSYYLINR